MKSISLPLFIYEPLDMGIYSSVEDAEKDLEPIDVQNGNYRGYDAIGHLLKLKIILQDNIQLVKIELAEYEPNHVEDLKTDLKEFLQETGDLSEGEKDLNLTELIEKSKKYIIELPESSMEVFKDFFVDFLKSINPFKNRSKS